MRELAEKLGHQREQDGCGDDTDTVAAIAGSLAGAVHGASAVPPAWRELVHGWPFGTDGRARTGDDLVRLAELAVR